MTPLKDGWLRAIDELSAVDDAFSAQLALIWPSEPEQIAKCERYLEVLFEVRQRSSSDTEDLAEIQGFAVSLQAGATGAALFLLECIEGTCISKRLEPPPRRKWWLNAVD